MASPRLVTILPDNTLGMEPLPELDKLRGKRRHYEDLRLGDGAPHVLDGADGDCLEIAAVFPQCEACELGLIVQGTDEIAYDHATGQLAGAPFALAPGEALSLRVYVDRSVTEIFANGRFCKTIRTYHRPKDSKAVSLFARGGEDTVASVDVWPMREVG